MQDPRKKEEEQASKFLFPNSNFLEENTQIRQGYRSTNLLALSSRMSYL
jgi:hypothetical protein